MFVDASAIVAILTREPDADRLADTLEAALSPITSPIAITEEEMEAALDAFARYGKGRRHPAQLNMGDCFAYSVAKTRGTPLLFKGEDFNKTDIAIATGRR